MFKQVLERFKIYSSNEGQFETKGCNLFTQKNNNITALFLYENMIWGERGENLYKNLDNIVLIDH